MTPDASSRPIRHALVTGATGFIGSHLVERLLALGVCVRALVRDTTRAHWLEALGAELVAGDITHPASLMAAIAKMDTIFHAAAVVGPAHVSADVYRAVNVEGTRHLIHACQVHSHVERFVHISSVAALGPPQVDTVAHEENLPRPVEIYGVTKLAGEHLVIEAHRDGFPVVVARPGWTYGPRSRGTSKLFRLIARGKFFLVGAARNVQQPLWIGDLVDGLLRCATMSKVEGEVYNFAGQRLTTEHFCRLIATATGGTIPAIRPPVWLAHSVACLCETLFPLWRGHPPLDRRKVDFFRLHHAYAIQKAWDVLQWQPRTPCEDGIRMTAQWLRTQGVL